VKRYRFAIVGLGAAAREIHLPAYRGLAQVELVGAADPVARERFPFPVFETAAELLAQTRPDVVAVLTPPASHFEIARMALEAGCHVLCEKPVTPTLEEADALAALARKAERRLVVNQEYRFMRIHQAAKAALGGPAFGDLVFLSAEQTFFTTASSEAGWRGRDPERTAKEFGIHILDLCRFFFEDEPVAVSARMPRPGQDTGPDRLDLIRLDFPGDRVAQITLDRLTRGRHRYLALRLDGTRACIETEIGGAASVRAGLRARTRRPFLEVDFALGGQARMYTGERFHKLAAEPRNVFARATQRLCSAFLDALDRGTVPPCSIEDNRKSLALVRAAYESAARGAIARAP